MFSGETTKTNVIALYIVFGFKGPVLKHKIYRTQDKHPGFQVRGGAHLLVITLMKKGNKETVKLDNSVEEMNFSSETSVKLSPCNFSGI
jgi:hypothetical protein